MNTTLRQSLNPSCIKNKLSMLLVGIALALLGGCDENSAIDIHKPAIATGDILGDGGKNTKNQLLYNCVGGDIPFNTGDTLQFQYFDGRKEAVDIGHSETGGIGLKGNHRIQEVVDEVPIYNMVVTKDLRGTN